jgi:hypothetical protein
MPNVEGQNQVETWTFAGLRKPRPLFVCDACGWRKVAHSRYIMAWPEAQSRFELEIVADPDYWYITRRSWARLRD